MPTTLDMPATPCQLLPETEPTTIGTMTYEGFWASSGTLENIVEVDRIAANPINKRDPSGLDVDPDWTIDQGEFGLGEILYATAFADHMYTDLSIRTPGIVKDIADAVNQLLFLRNESVHRANYHYDRMTPGPNHRDCGDTTSLAQHQQAYNYWKRQVDKYTGELKYLFKMADGVGIGFVPMAGIGRSKALERYNGLKSQIEEHLENLRNNPTSQDVPHWRGEVQSWIKQIEDVTDQMGKKTAAQIVQEIAKWKQQLGG
jgi:hypothetical protein